MKIRITDDELPGEELILDVANEDDDPFDEVQLTKDEAFEVIGFWESSTQVGGRGSYDPEDHGIIVLAQVERTGDEIEQSAWYEEDRDGYFPLSAFPFTTLHSEEVTS